MSNLLKQLMVCFGSYNKNSRNPARYKCLKEVVKTLPFSLIKWDKIQHTLGMQPRHFTPVYLPKIIENENDIHPKKSTLISIEALFIVAPNWKQPKCSSTGERINSVASTQWKYSHQ